ncbi:MAG TPA: CbiX/SirB N-terminal domain-containing protein [Gemmatimonadaceae bacterium]
MKAILLIDHGSVRAAANHMLECMGALVQQLAGDGTIVRIGHMELAEPTIAQGFEACVSAGATEIVAFPYMLSPGKHSTRDIPRLVGEAAARFPAVAYTVTPAFGVHELLAEAVLDRVGIPLVAQASSVTERSRCCMRPAGAPERYCGDGCRAAMDKSAPVLSQ